MPDKLNADEQAIIDKARNMASETIGQGGDDSGPPPGPATPSTPTGGDTWAEVWGPYSDGQYHYITPPWGGSFGVPPGQQLYFEEADRLIKGEIRTIKIPRYRDIVATAKAEAEAEAAHEVAEEEALAETKAKMANKKKEKASA